MPFAPDLKWYTIIPAYNEARYLERVLEKARAVTPNILVVDDGSTDGTGEIARRTGATVLRHRVNLGKGAAMKTGCEYAFGRLHADAVVFLDADDQHDPEDLPQFIEPLQAGAEMVFGCRVFDASMPRVRLLGNRLASYLLWMFFGTYIPDVPSGYKSFTRAAYDRLRWNATGYEVETEIAARVAQTGIRFVTHPIKTIYHDRVKGMTLQEALQIALRLPFWKMRR